MSAGTSSRRRTPVNVAFPANVLPSKLATSLKIARPNLAVAPTTTPLNEANSRKIARLNVAFPANSVPVKLASPVKSARSNRAVRTRQSVSVKSTSVAAVRSRSMSGQNASPGLPLLLLGPVLGR